MKDQIKSWVELLQERGIPRLLPLVEEGRFDAVKVAETSSQYPVFMSGGDRVGGVIVSVPDLLATFAWLDPTKLLKRLNAEVDELSDDEHALTDAQRAEQLAEIESDRLATEREEEHLIELAEGQGLNIARRTEADPRAVLGLSSELPSPREH